MITFLITAYLIMGFFTGLIALNVFLREKSLDESAYFKKANKFKRFLAIVVIVIVVAISWPWWVSGFLSRFI